MGVAYDYASDKARTLIIENVAGLEQLKGSKYIQSYTEDALHSFAERARSNPSQRFICIGTPCQIYGLRSLAQQKRLKNEILYVDLFCHGVPSHLVWEPYIKRLRNRLGGLKSVNFRYKGHGWHQYSIRVVGERGTYCNYAYNDTFYRYFFDNVALNTSCYTCKLRQRFAPSDIRIGDFLGRAYEHREDGISAVVAITSKGQQAITSLVSSQRISIVGTHTAEEPLKAQCTEDYKDIELRNEVIARLKDGDIEATKRWYLKRFSPKRRLYLRLKSLTTLLPQRWMVALRRARRASR
jgi:coenzyme F420-reducing hydrogenase beta subunit